MRSGFYAGAPPRGTFSEVGRWDLHDVGDVRLMRVQLAALVPADRPVPTGGTESVRDRLLLVASELASNALRHGGGEAAVVLSSGEDGWLLVVTDPAGTVDPQPARDRAPGEGGYGLYLVQALGLATGWYSGAGLKHVWAHVAVES